MKNEDKAREIAVDNCTHAGCSHGEHYFSSGCDCYKSAMQMADWKDEGFLEWLKTIDTYSLKEKSRYIKLAIKKLENTMANKKKYRIVTDHDNIFCVEELKQQTWCLVFRALHGKAGLELAEEWIENRKEN